MRGTGGTEIVNRSIEDTPSRSASISAYPALEACHRLRSTIVGAAALTAWVDRVANTPSTWLGQPATALTGQCRWQGPGSAPSPTPSRRSGSPSSAAARPSALVSSISGPPRVVRLCIYKIELGYRARLVRARAWGSKRRSVLPAAATPDGRRSRAHRSTRSTSHARVSTGTPGFVRTKSTTPTADESRADEQAGGHVDHAEPGANALIRNAAAIPRAPVIAFQPAIAADREASRRLVTDDGL